MHGSSGAWSFLKIVTLFVYCSVFSSLWPSHCVRQSWNISMHCWWTSQFIKGTLRHKSRFVSQFARHWYKLWSLLLLLLWCNGALQLLTTNIATKMLMRRMALCVVVGIWNGNNQLSRGPSIKDVQLTLGLEKTNRKDGHPLLFSMKFYCLNRTHGGGVLKVPIFAGRQFISSLLIKIKLHLSTTPAWYRFHLLFFYFIIEIKDFSSRLFNLVILIIIWLVGLNNHPNQDSKSWTVYRKSSNNIWASSLENG